MLESYGVEYTSDIKLEKIRNPVTRKMTSILNGNRFIYAKPPPHTRGQAFAKECILCWLTMPDISLWIGFKAITVLYELLGNDPLSVPM